MTESLWPQRTFWRTNVAIVRHGYDSWEEDVLQQVPENMANLVGSRTTDGKHMPTLDIDVPLRLIPSSTPGHSHLYIDVEMSWWRYRRLLRQLYKARLIEKGFYQLALGNRQTFLRRPGVTKQNEAAFHAVSHH